MLKDPGGEPLDQILERHEGQPLNLTRSLRIKPANVLFVDAGNLGLTGFGIASHLPNECQSPVPPEIIADTLAYMVPEQIGRMNRSIGTRSDLYSLDVTLVSDTYGRAAVCRRRPPGVSPLPCCAPADTIW